MANNVTLTCPSCGGKLQITPDIERFACGYCGNEHIVRRAGGIISLTPIVEGLEKVQIGVDKTASELAIKRLREELERLQIRFRDEVNNTVPELLEMQKEVKSLEEKIAELDQMVRQKKDEYQYSSRFTGTKTLGSIVILLSLFIFLELAIANDSGSTLISSLIGFGVLCGILVYVFIKERRKSIELPKLINKYVTEHAVERKSAIQQIEALNLQIDLMRNSRINQLKSEIDSRKEMLSKHYDIVSKT